MTSRRLLIVRVGALGDVLHALPAVAAVGHQQPGVFIDWVVDSRWQSLLMDENGHGPVVNQVFPAETRAWSARPFSLATMRSLAGLRTALRQTHYDAVVDMQGTLRSGVLGRLAPASVFAGYADPRERAAALLYSRRLPRRGAHVVEQGAALLEEALGTTLAPAACPLPQSPVANAWAEQILRAERSGCRMALLAPTAGWAAKEWPVSRYAELARALHRAQWRVLVNAPETGGAVAQAVVDASGGAANVLPCSVAQLLALIRRAALVVGGDSGPVHLAAAVGTPVIGLYGPTDPARNGPWGPGPKAVLRDPSSVTSYKHTAVADPGLTRIRESDVLAAVERLT